MTYNVKIASYNTGTKADYSNVHKGQGARTAEIGKKAFSSLAEQNVDLFCLQEAYNYDDSDIFHTENRWTTDQFDYIRTESGLALVWNNSRFSLIKGSITKSEDFLIADLYDQTNKKVIRVASLHIPGYNIESLQTDDKKKEFDRDVNNGSSMTAVVKCLGDLLKDKEADFTIVGSDTNSIPKIYDRFHRTFECNGLSYDKKDQEPTNQYIPPSNENVEGIKDNENVEGKKDDHEKRQIDFIFKSRFLSSKKEERPEQLNLKNPENPSDHIPVIQTLRMGFFASIFKMISDFFSGKQKPEVAQKDTFEQPVEVAEDDVFKRITTQVELRN
ncbi:MAG: hypothetical protein H7A39_06320 [Chlamydiales bacterium]|nr:hypothetical protein [Chlamydiales bacterium]